MSTGHTGDEVRVGFAGAGTIAGIHMPNLLQIDGVRIVAVSDVDEERARARASEFGARAYGDAREMLDAVDLDALFVCLPPFAHGDIVEHAVARGLHLYMEKPVALDLASALHTAALVREAGVIASVGYMWRYAPVVEQAKALLDPAHRALLLGRMLNGPNASAWSLDRSLSGGLLVEFATHLFDLLRYLGGEITHVSGTGTEVMPGPPSRGPDSAVLALRYANGAAGSLATTWAFSGAIWDVQVVAPTATLHLNLNPERLQGKARDEPIDTSSPIPAGVQPHGFSGGPSWFLAAQAFVMAIRNGDPTLVRSSYEDGARTLALTLAADEAVRTGRTIEVAQV